MTGSSGQSGQSPAPALLRDVSPLSARYPVWFCDIWGVVHDGVKASPQACRALMRHRENGGVVVLITNSPRPTPALIEQLDGLKVPRAAWDAIVTSGDVTRDVIRQRAGGKVFHLGPEKDAHLRDGLPVSFTGADEAATVLCSGLYDDQNEQPEQYREMLRKLAARGLDMVCANPDVKVRHGGRVIPCAGALAAIYEEEGGHVIMAGKPFAPIFEACLEKAREAAGRDVKKDEILAIGDGIATDILGARNFGIAALYIATGIHHEELLEHGLTAIIGRIYTTAPGVKLAGVMESLVWKDESQ